MFIVTREISPYTHHDIIIGIFNNYQEALKAKSLYITNCATYDKWREQAYREVNLETDITINDISNQLNNKNNKANTIYVVSRFEEGFGQIIRFYEKFCDTKNEAKNYISIKEEDEADFPYYYDYEKIIINNIYFEEQESNT